MAVTYFGHDSTGGAQASSYHGGWVYNNDAVVDYVCPGSGPQLVKALQVYIDREWTAFDYKVAVHDADGNLVCSVSGSVAFGDGLDWRGVAEAVGSEDSISPAGTTLTGGASYRLGFSVSASACQVRYTARAGSAYTNVSVLAFGSTPPATLGTVDSTDERQICLRCGVEPAAAGPAWTPRVTMVMGG